MKIFYTLIFTISIIFYSNAQTFDDSLQLAEDNYSNGNWREMVGIYEKLFVGRLPIDSLSDKTTLFRMLENCATGYYMLGLNNKALPLYLEIKPHAESIVNEEHYLFISKRLANVYIEMELYANAETLLFEIKNRTAKLNGKSSKEYAEINLEIGVLYFRSKQYNKAEKLYLETAELLKKVSKRDKKPYLKVCNNIARLYKTMGDFKKSEEYYLIVKNLNEEIFGKNHESYINSCVNLAFLHKEKKAFEKAEAYFLEAKSIAEVLYKNDSEDFFIFCNDLAYYYYEVGMYKKSEAIYIEIQQLQLKNGGSNQLSYANNSIDLANLYLKMNLANKAEPLFLEAKDIQEKLLGKENVKYAVSCMRLSDIYLDQRLYEKTESLLMEAKNIQVTFFNEQKDWHANICAKLGILYQKQGKTNEAETYFLESKFYYKSIAKNSDYAMSCSNLAYFYEEQGFNAKALSLRLEAKTIMENLGRYDENYAHICHYLANYFRENGLFSQSEKLYIETKAKFEQFAGKNNRTYVSICSNLGSLYLSAGMYSEAEGLLMECKELNLKLFGEQSIEIADSYLHLSLLAHEMGLKTKSESLLITAKTILEKLNRKNSNLYGTICNNLALVYRSKNDYKRAEELFIESNTISIQLLGEESSSTVKGYINLGLLYIDQENYNKANEVFSKAKNYFENQKKTEDYSAFCLNYGWLNYKQGNNELAEIWYKKGKDIIGHLFGTNHKRYAKSCSYLAELYVKTNNIQLAVPLYKDLIKNIIKEIDELLPSMTEKERSEYYKGISFYFKEYYNFTIQANRPELYSDLLNLQLKIKGLIFQSTQKMHTQILLSKNEKLIQKFEEWKSQRSNYNAVSKFSKEEQLKNGINVDSLLNSINLLEVALSKESSYFANTQKIKKLTWRDIQNSLLPNEAAIEIIRTDSTYMALIITPSTKENPELVLFDNGDKMDNGFINFYRNSIKHKISDEYSYVNFWKPIQDKLGPTNKVFLCADGVYHKLNLLTLKNPKNQKYVFEEVSIQLLSNLTDIINANKIDVVEKYENYKIHLIAYPQYDNPKNENESDRLNIHNTLSSDTTQRFYSSLGNITMLPGTKSEAKNIESLCKKLNINNEVKILTNASEEYIKSLRNPPILHIATHGFFIANDETVNKNKSIDHMNPLKRDPLLNCGLLLANAQQGMRGNIKNGEDGILTANEALNLNLDSTELVIMSACETGLGEIKNGEGVYGLQRSFQQAGAKTVIISLWKVSDDATQELMSNFYINLLEKKQNKRLAFTNAQHALRIKFPDPYYWGAFVIIGQ